MTLSDDLVRHHPVGLVPAWLPDDRLTPIGPDTLRDAGGNAPVRAVLQADLDAAASAGERVIFLGSLPASNNASRLQVNDRDGLRLAFATEAATIDDDLLQQALVDLQSMLGGPLRVYPHAGLAPACRRLAPVAGLGFGWRAYPSGLQPDINRRLEAYGRGAGQRDIRHAGMPEPRRGSLTHLDRLEAESLFIMREAVAGAENPVMLYSIGKDSSVLLHLARKAFYPGDPPFPLLHIDTRWKFREMIQFRDAVTAQAGMRLLVHTNPQAIENDINPFVHGSALHTDITKTEGLKQALDEYRFDVAFGGARRDEEKSRAKERVFSFRHAGHRWDPKNQRPELWNLYNTNIRPGQSLRVFPLSNWTELDIWQYIARENIPIVPLYFAASRPVIERDGLLMMVDDDRLPLRDQDEVRFRQVRFRTLGCYPLTGAIESNAQSLDDIVLELLGARSSERQGRAIDNDGSGSMERKKQEGYF